MKKLILHPKTAGPSSSADLPKNAGSEQPEPGPPTDNSTTHNGSASAFDATEEVRDDEDSDEDNDDFARDYK